MGKWQLIGARPDTGKPPWEGTTVLVFGKPEDLVINGDVLVHFKKPLVCTANWDELDGAFCLTGGSWLGPFIEPTHWMSLPEPPDA